MPEFERHLIEGYYMIFVSILIRDRTFGISVHNGTGPARMILPDT